MSRFCTNFGCKFRIKTFLSVEILILQMSKNGTKTNKVQTLNRQGSVLFSFFFSLFLSASDPRVRHMESDMLPSTIIQFLVHEFKFAIRCVSHSLFTFQFELVLGIFDILSIVIVFFPSAKHSLTTSQYNLICNLSRSIQ